MCQNGFGAEAVRTMADLIKQVKVAEPAMQLVLRLIRTTHPDAPHAPDMVRKYVRYGASTSPSSSASGIRTMSLKKKRSSCASGRG